MKPSLVIVGLGNPGASYAATRHNAGFLAVDRLSEAYGEGEWREVQKFRASVQEARVVAAAVLLVKPLTYMNRSGETVQKICSFYKLDPATQILVLVDDIDIPVGSVRLRRSGGPGTHNGLASIVEQMGEGFPRLRIGIGPKPDGADLAAWVLSKFSAEETQALIPVYDALPDALRRFVMGED